MDDRGNLKPTGERGEIVVRGSLVMDGYYKDPEATEWHHTGDIGYLDADNFLYILISINPIRGGSARLLFCVLENPLELRSSGFRNGTRSHVALTCDGEAASPPLVEWSGAPAGTRSFVLLCDDPDAPAGTWHHWAVYDIPADQTGLTEGAARGAAGKTSNK